MRLNDAVGPREIPRPQGIEHHLMVAGGALLLHPGVAGQQIVGHNELALDPVIDLAETPVPGLLHQHPVEVQVRAAGTDHIVRFVGEDALPGQTVQRLIVHRQRLALNVRQCLMLQQKANLNDVAHFLLAEGRHGEMSLAGKHHHALGMHPLQSLLHRRPADAVALGQLVQVQGLAR